MCAWMCGAGGGRRGGSRYYKHRAWAVGSAKSLSESHTKSVYRTYIGESLQGSLHCSAEPGQGL